MDEKQYIKEIIEKMAKESVRCGWAEQETGEFERLDKEFKKFIKEHPEYKELDRMINPIMQYGWNQGLTQSGPFHRTGGDSWGSDEEGQRYALRQAEKMD